MTQAWILFAGILFLGLSSAHAQDAATMIASSPAQGAPDPVLSGGPVEPSEYRIGPEDVLQIAVWKSEALSRTVTVRPDGKISLPLLNDVQVAGVTPMQLRKVLVGQLQEYLPSPEVSVIVAEPRSFKVSVMGEVARPGRYELKSRTTVLDIIALAGGLNQFATRGKIVLLRPDGKGSQQRLLFNYNKAIAAGGEQENVAVQPGDILVVP